MRQLSLGDGRQKDGEEKPCFSQAPVKGGFNSSVSTGTGGEQVM